MILVQIMLKLSPSTQAICFIFFKITPWGTPCCTWSNVEEGTCCWNSRLHLSVGAAKDLVKAMHVFRPFQKGSFFGISIGKHFLVSKESGGKKRKFLRKTKMAAISTKKYLNVRLSNALHTFFFFSLLSLLTYNGPKPKPIIKSWTCISSSCPGTKDSTQNSLSQRVPLFQTVSQN